MNTPDDYGAPGTGDESDALQAWASDVAGKRRGYLPRAYGLGRAITFPDNLDAYGDGPDCGITALPSAAPDSPLLYVGSNVRLANMRIDCADLAPGRTREVVALSGNGSRLETFAFRGDGFVSLGVAGSRNELVDLAFWQTAMSIWDGGKGNRYTRPKFHDTTATPFTVGGTDTVIEQAVGENIGENAIMSAPECERITVNGFRLRNVHRIGDNGTAFEIHGKGWRMFDLDVCDVDWSILLLFDPQDFLARGLTLRNPGRGSFIETGNDSSACIKLYSRARSFGRPAPRDVVITDFVLTDDADARAHAVQFQGHDDSEQFSNIYIGAGTMPGRWREGRAVEVRDVTTGGVLRSVCGPRCYVGVTPQP